MSFMPGYQQVNVYVLPQIYSKVRQLALRLHRPVYELVNEALQGSIEFYENDPKGKKALVDAEAAQEAKYEQQDDPDRSAKRSARRVR